MTRRLDTTSVSRRHTSTLARELNLSLGCALTHANAVLRWIDTDDPDLDDVIAHLRAIRDAGRRAADLVRAVRSAGAAG